nr:MAG TPA: hypothetical protein [Inoviridae sp.]
MLSTLSSGREVYCLGYYYYFLNLGCGKCGWLLHMQMVRSRP